MSDNSNKLGAKCVKFTLVPNALFVGKYSGASGVIFYAAVEGDALVNCKEIVLSIKFSTVLCNLLKA